MPPQTLMGYLLYLYKTIHILEAELATICVLLWQSTILKLQFTFRSFMIKLVEITKYKTIVIY